MICLEINQFAESTTKSQQRLLCESSSLTLMKELDISFSLESAIIQDSVIQKSVAKNRGLEVKAILKVSDVTAVIEIIQRNHIHS